MGEGGGDWGLYLILNQSILWAYFILGIQHQSVYYTLCFTTHLLDPFVHLKKGIPPAIHIAPPNKSLKPELLADQVNPNTRSYWGKKKQVQARWLSGESLKLYQCHYTKIRSSLVVGTDLATQSHSSKGVHHWNDCVKKFTSDLHDSRVYRSNNKLATKTVFHTNY